MGNSQYIIARNLRLLMRHHKLRQSQTARESGVSKQTISNILNPHDARSTVSVAVLIKIADYFKVPVNYFFITDMTAEILLDKGLNELIKNYLNSTENGMAKIRTLAEIEVQLKKNGLDEHRLRERRQEQHNRRLNS